MFLIRALCKFVPGLENVYFLYISVTMQKKMLYSVPACRVGGVCVERCFLQATITGGNITPGEDPGTGGSWNFGDED